MTFSFSYPTLCSVSLAAFCLGWIVYQRFLSPLSQIPGPFWASISRLWYLRKINAEDMHRYTKKLHDRYGPIVRIAPNECSVCDPQAWKEIYAVNGGFTKTDFYLTQAPNLSPHADSFTQLDEKRHTFRRRMIQHIFAFKTVLENEKYVDPVIELFMQRMGELADRGDAFDISEYTFDVIGELFFGRAFGFLRESKDIGGYIAAVDIILPHAIRMAVLPKVLWPLQILMLPFSATFRHGVSVFNSLTAVSKKLVDERVESGKGRPDMLEKLLEVSREKSPDFDITDVYTESYTAIFAGSDTTAIAIRSALYNLCKNPDTYTKLQGEIDRHEAEGKLSPIVTYAEASRMPYLSAVCKEAMRVFPPIALTFPRHVPEGGRELCGHYIPAGYRVGVNPATFHFVKSIFGEDADDFNPDRWFRSEAKEMDRHMFQFGQGTRQCIGKNVAAVEMWKFLPQFLRSFRIELVDPKAEWKEINYWFVKQVDINVWVYRR
ncbi:Pisatin demethylase [Lasiodiplodia theobromae]|uniref:Pisatin demethylase n=1 Tax=Lasiodiplodia theobromae TaxID=45133 RepID=UPI0015C37B08|nr:Pisatin demethylase [Lasiodiplodia theobromae]KAF4534195.1 Pisatin demethylase [Lasiodiplodia theobromae]